MVVELNNSANGESANVLCRLLFLTAYLKEIYRVYSAFAAPSKDGLKYVGDPNEPDHRHIPEIFVFSSW